mmetsp:Transcript_134057/g.334579  ORF Transcript_134057/g.334579 Transcript_134057/m.334579 type:complete len:206 (+) Transcript_134057:272-889(+)
MMGRTGVVVSERLIFGRAWARDCVSSDRVLSRCTPTPTLVSVLSVPYLSTGSSRRGGSPRHSLCALPLHAPFGTTSSSCGHSLAEAPTSFSMDCGSASTSGVASVTTFLSRLEPTALSPLGAFDASPNDRRDNLFLVDTTLGALSSWVALDSGVQAVDNSTFSENDSVALFFFLAAGLFSFLCSSCFLFFSRACMATCACCKSLR